jgi:hypothetical protein
MPSGYGEDIVETGYDWDDEESGYEDDDESGYEEDLVGDDVVDDIIEAISGSDELVGARRKKRRRRPKRRVSKAVMRKLKATQFRRYPLGLGVTNLLAGASAVLTVTPQLPYKLMRISTPSTNITIDNIQIGTVSQFVAAGGVPSECMAPNAINAELKGDTCVPGVQIQITVTDVSGAANTFRACLWGLVAQ